MNAPVTIPETGEKYVIHTRDDSLNRLRLQSAAWIGCGVAAAMGCLQLAMLLGAVASQHLFAAFVGTSAFVYLAIALEQDQIGMVANLLFGGLLFALAVRALSAPPQYLALLFLAQGIWSGWVAGWRQVQSEPPEPLWAWCVFNFTLAAVL